MYIYSVHFQKHKAQLQIRDWIHYNQITSKCFFMSLHLTLPLKKQLHLVKKTKIKIEWKL